MVPVAVVSLGISRSVVGRAVLFISKSSKFSPPATSPDTWTDQHRISFNNIPTSVYSPLTILRIVFILNC